MLATPTPSLIREGLTVIGSPSNILTGPKTIWPASPWRWIVAFLWGLMWRLGPGAGVCLCEQLWLGERVAPSQDKPCLMYGEMGDKRRAACTADNSC